MYLKLPSLRLRNSWDEIHGPFQSSIYLSCQAFWTELITSFSLKSSPSWFLSQKCTCFPPASLDPLWKSSRHHCSPSVLIFLPWTTSFLSKAWLSTPLVILMFVSPAQTFLLDSRSLFPNCPMDSCSWRSQKHLKLSMIKTEFILWPPTPSLSHLSNWQTRTPSIMQDLFFSLPMWYPEWWLPKMPRSFSLEHYRQKRDTEDWLH